MISAVVLTKNEEGNIEGCLTTLKWCNEVIVVDDYSQDSTPDVARKLGATAYRRHLNDDFAAQRNFGLEKARGEWVLFVDADERVTSSLREEIIQYTNNPIYKYSNGYVGFYVKRRDFMWARELKHGEVGSIKLLRLAKKSAGRWRRRVHEVWEVKGRVGTLKNPLLHYPHQSLRGFARDVGRMSTLHARAHMEQGVRSNPVKIIFWPPAKFFYNWVLRLGFLDGTPGFLVAAVMSFHSFLSWSKLSLYQQNIKHKA